MPLFATYGSAAQFAASVDKSNVHTGGVASSGVPSTHPWVLQVGFAAQTSACVAAQMLVAGQAWIFWPVALYSGCSGPVGVVPSWTFRTNFVTGAPSGTPWPMRSKYTADRRFSSPWRTVSGSVSAAWGAGDVSCSLAGPPLTALYCWSDQYHAVRSFPYSKQNWMVVPVVF